MAVERHRERLGVDAIVLAVRLTGTGSRAVPGVGEVIIHIAAGARIVGIGNGDDRRGGCGDRAAHVEVIRAVQFPARRGVDPDRRAVRGDRIVAVNRGGHEGQVGFRCLPDCFLRGGSPIPRGDAGADLTVAVAVEVSVNDFLPVPRQGRGRIDADHAGVMDRIDLPIRPADQGKERPHLIVGEVGLLVVAVRESHGVGQGLVQTVARNASDSSLMVRVPHIVGSRVSHILEVNRKSRGYARGRIGDKSGRGELALLVRRDRDGGGIACVGLAVHRVDDLRHARPAGFRRHRIACRIGLGGDFTASRTEGAGRPGSGKRHGSRGGSRRASARSGSAARAGTRTAGGRALFETTSRAGIAGEGMGGSFRLARAAGAGQGALMLAVGDRRPGSVVPGVGLGRSIEVDPAVVAVLIGFVLGTGSVFILPGIVRVGAALGVPAEGAGVAVERMVFPSGIAPSRQGLSAGIALRVIRMLIRVLILADFRGGRMGAGFLLMSAYADAGGVVAVVFPTGIAPALLHFAADRALALIRVHLFVLDHVDLRPVVGAGRRSGDGHQPEERDDRQQQGQDFGEFLHLGNTSFNQSRFHRESI